MSNPNLGPSPTPTSPNNLTVIQPLTLADFESLRSSQSDALMQARTNALNSNPAGSTTVTALEDAFSGAAKARIDSAEQAESASLLAGCEDFASRYFDKNSDPVKFNGLVDLMREYSSVSMDGFKWNYGDLKPDYSGYEPGTSGRELFQQKMNRLVNAAPASPDPTAPTNPDPTTPGSPDDTPDDPTTPDALVDAARLEFEAVDTTLNAARVNFAEASIKKRAHWRKSGKKARALNEKFEAAKQAYEQAQQQAGVKAVEYLRLDNIDDEMLKAAVMEGIINEKRKFSQQEQALLEEDSSRWGKISRWMAKHRIVANLMLGGTASVAGAGVGLGFRALKWGATAAGPVGFAVGIATKMLGAGRHVALGRAKLIRDIEERSNEDNQNLLEKVSSLNINSAADAGALATQATGLVSENISDRAEKDVVKNRSDIATAALFAGAMGLAGAGLFNLAADHFHWFDGGGAPVPNKPPEGTGKFKEWLAGYARDFYEKNGIKVPSAHDKKAAFDEAMSAIRGLSSVKETAIDNLAEAVKQGTDPARLFDVDANDVLYGFYGGSAK
jgi:hypothetical protein